MPKNDTRPTATPAQPPVPASGIQIPPAAHAVLALLDPVGGATTAELAERAGLGRSTVTKALAALSEARLAVRKPGGHDGARRIADLWFAAVVTGAASDRLGASEAGLGEPSGTDEGADATAAGVEDGADAEPNTSQQAPATEPESTGTGAEAAGEESGDQHGLLAVPGPARADDGRAGEPGTAHDAQRGLAPGVVASAEPLQPGADDSPSETASNGAAQEQVQPAEGSAPAAPERLGKGELREQVERHLREHPERAWTPSAIAKVLDRSAGAIKNAGDKLVELGSAITFEDAPTRYQYSGNR